VVGGALSGLWVALTVAAAEALTRRAFPRHYDWYAYPRAAGAPPVAARLLGGYALAAFGFAYVTLFYLTTRSALGWWVPTESLDNPNAIATPLPWVSALGTSLFAGTWEEALFRAVPLALLSLWVRDRPRAGAGTWRRASVVTALAFGLRARQLPVVPGLLARRGAVREAALWAVLYLRVGLPTTIVAHALYDLGWFGCSRCTGAGRRTARRPPRCCSPPALPALVVAAGWWRSRRAASFGTAVADPPRLGDWRPADEAPDLEHAPAPPAGVAPHAGDDAGYPLPRSAGDARVGALAPPLGARTRAAALAVAAARCSGRVRRRAPNRRAPATPHPQPPWLAWPTRRSAPRGVDPARWDRTLQAGALPREQQRRFLRDALGREGAAAAGAPAGRDLLVPAFWEARYVRRAARSPSAVRSGA
jgi:hypothetical protein